MDDVEMTASGAAALEGDDINRRKIKICVRESEREMFDLRSGGKNGEINIKGIARLPMMAVATEPETR